MRLCNPCVPDPNIAPPQSLQLVDSNRQFLRNSNNTHARSASTTSASLSTLLSVENPSHESLDPTSTFSRYHNRGPGSSSIMDNDQSSSSNIPARGPAYRWRGSRASRPEGSDSRSRSSTVRLSWSSSKSKHWSNSILTFDRLETPMGTLKLYHILYHISSYF